MPKPKLTAQEKQVLHDLVEIFRRLEDAAEKTKDPEVKHLIRDAMTQTQLTMHRVEADLHELNKIQDATRLWASSTAELEEMFKDRL